MLLYVKGVCSNCRTREVLYNGGAKKFTAHRCRMIDPTGDFDALYIETGEVPLERGKTYIFPVRVKPYQTKKGDTRFEYVTYKDFPPQEVPTAK